MRRPSAFFNGIHPGQIIKFEGSIDNAERTLFAEVFNTEPFESEEQENEEERDRGIEVDVNTHVLPADEFYTLRFPRGIIDAERSEDTVELFVQGRSDSPELAGTVRKMMVYEPLE